MKPKELTDLSQLCIHTITLKPWSIEEAAKKFSASGVKGITVWRDTLEGRNIKQTGKMLREHAFEHSSASFYQIGIQGKIRIRDYQDFLALLESEEKQHKETPMSPQAKASETHWGRRFPS